MTLLLVKNLRILRLLMIQAVLQSEGKLFLKKNLYKLKKWRTLRESNTYYFLQNSRNRIRDKLHFF